MPQLFTTDLGVLSRPVFIDGVVHQLPPSAIAVARQTGLSDGIPFILGDDGAYEHELNRFFRACPTMGVRSRNSLRAYARDVLTWLRFLAERRGKTVWQADREDLAAYHAARRRSAPPYRITAASWNRSVAALEKLYGWAAEEGVIATPPFGFGMTWRRLGGRLVPVRTSRAREPGARRGDMHFVDMDSYILFRDVGLRGRRPDGSDDPMWRGRHGQRNALFAELLVTTGMRLEEAASLLAAELLPLAARGYASKQRTVPFRLPASIAKGNKAREIRLPIRLLNQIAEYADLERANATANAHARTKDDPIVALRLERETVIIAAPHEGAHPRLRLDLLTPAERRRLVLGTRDGPAAILWLGESGEPMTPAAWEAAFRRASARCRSFGIDLDVTPHMLRHTFAVNMLAMLIREQIGAILREGPGADDGPGAGVYRRMIGDPLQKLQRLMGHASIASTHIYLNTLEESRALIEAAAERWAVELGAGAEGAP